HPPVRAPPALLVQKGRAHRVVRRGRSGLAGARARPPRLASTRSKHRAAARAPSHEADTTGRRSGTRRGPRPGARRTEARPSMSVRRRYARGFGLWVFVGSLTATGSRISLTFS